ncbi:hypothetical protein [Microbacterium aurantiacum]|nr:hypothetical protein [Microbacterium aurantiacum]ODT11239.1 MAG: hypothetical protein ABS61_04970 [Microbacterium sp. SCN 70-18]
MSETDAATLRRRRRDVPIGVVMVGMSLVVWWPAFTVGVWGEIFYTQILALWAASTAAFVFVLVERRPVGVRLLRAFLLLLPTALIILMFVINDEEEDIFILLIDVAALLAVLIGLPFTLWVLVRIVWPDFAHEMSAGTKWLITVVVLGVAVVAFVLGLLHPYFLNCEDFTIAGNLPPDGCTPMPEE